MDAQPLIVPRVRITAGDHQGRHDVVYVATEADSIYAIDAEKLILPAGINTAGAAQSDPQTTTNNAKEKAGEPKVVARDVFGVVRTIKGSQLTIQGRMGQLIQIDATTAMQAHLSVIPVVGHAVEVRGTMDSSGVVHAETILRAKDSPAMWAADR